MLAKVILFMIEWGVKVNKGYLNVLVLKFTSTSTSPFLISLFIYLLIH